MSSLLIVVGLSVVGVGVLLRYVPWALSWFGNLPGDIRREGDRVSAFVPITSMIVVSVFLSIVLSLVVRFLRGQ